MPQIVLWGVALFGRVYLISRASLLFKKKYWISRFERKKIWNQHHRMAVASFFLDLYYWASIHICQQYFFNSSFHRASSRSMSRLRTGILTLYNSLFFMVLTLKKPILMLVGRERSFIRRNRWGVLICQLMRYFSSTSRHWFSLCGHLKRLLQAIIKTLLSSYHRSAKGDINHVGGSSLLYLLLKYKINHLI